MPVSAPFSRDELVAYEKSAPSPAASEQEATATPADATPAPEVESSSTEVSSDPAVPEQDATSAANADPAPASAESDGEATSDEEAVEETRPAKGSARSRIEELVDERNAMRKYAEWLIEENKRLQGAGGTAPATATAETASTSSDDEPPALEDYDYDPVKHAKAQSDWLKKQVQKQVQTALQATEQRQSQAQLIEKFNERVAAFAKANPDFSTVVSNPALPQFRPEIAKLIVKSENGPAINYHLGRNPDLAVRISKLPIEEQAIQIDRIERTLTASTTTQAPPTPKPKVAPKQKSGTQAPPPPTPTIGSTNAGKSPADMTMQEWVAYERGLKIQQREQRQKVRSAMR